MRPSTAELSPEQIGWLDAGRRYAEEVVRPVAAAWDAIVRPADVPSIELIREASRYGLRTMTVPVDLGGPGADAVSHCLVNEEVAAADLGTAIMLSQVARWTPVITRAMNDGQRARYLPEFLGNDAYFVAGAMTEAGAGSDNQAPHPDPAVGIQGSAVRDGDGWVLNGRKHFINGGGCASLFAILLRTDRTVSAYDGCTYFLVRAGTPGFRVVRLHDKLAGRLGSLAELELIDCRVGDAERLGDVNQGFQVRAWGMLGRLMDASQGVGVAREAVRIGVAWAAERQASGVRPIEQQAVGMSLAECAVDLEAARSLVWRAARAHDRGDDDAFALVCAAKHFAAEAGVRSARRALEVHGRGIWCGWPAEKVMRDAMSLLHIGGTQQIVLLRLAEQLDLAQQAGLLS